MSLKSAQVEYINARGSFVDPHTIEAIFKNGTKVSDTPASLSPDLNVRDHLQTYVRTLESP